MKTIIVVVLLALSCAAFAERNDVRQRTNVDTDVSSRVATGNSRAYSLSGGDMDIRDCVVTYSFLFGLMQGTGTNALCEAERMDRDGKYLQAAEMRCSTQRYKRVYKTDCVKRVQRTAADMARRMPLPPVTDSGDEDDDDRDDFIELVENVKQSAEKEIAKAQHSAQVATLQTQKAISENAEREAAAAQRRATSRAFIKRKDDD